MYPFLPIPYGNHASNFASCIFLRCEEVNYTLRTWKRTTAPCSRCMSCSIKIRRLRWRPVPCIPACWSAAWETSDCKSDKNCSSDRWSGGAWSRWEFQAPGVPFHGMQCPLNSAPSALLRLIGPRHNRSDTLVVFMQGFLLSAVNLLTYLAVEWYYKLMYNCAQRTRYQNVCN